MAEKVEFDVPASTIFKVILIILFFVFIYLLKDVITIIFLAIIIASGVIPFADWLEKKKIPRLLGVLGLYLIFFGLVILLLSLIIPFVSAEISQITKTLPEFVARISGALEQAQQSTSNRYFDFFNELSDILDNFSQYLQEFSSSVLNVIIGIFGGVLSFIAIIVISFYLSVMRNGLINFIKSVLPEKYENYVISLWKRSETKVGRWLQGQLLLALTVGLLVFIGLSLLHIPYALIFAIIAMILEIIPIVGPVISAIPPVVLAFTQSPALGIWTLLFFVLVQQTEGHLLTPIIMGKTLGLNPLTVIIAILIGGKMAGIIGILLAVPVAVIIVEILEDMAKQKESRRASV